MKVTMLENDSLTIEVLGEPLNEVKHIFIIRGDGSVSELYHKNDG